jgi:hypothetical protein
MEIDLTKIDSIEIEGIDHRDAPDYCDAYIANCDIDGREATEQELETINDNSDFVYEQVMNWIY